LIANGTKRLVLHVRDPRQVVVSWVHHVLRISEAEFQWSALMYDPPLPAAFRTWEFQQQIDWALENYMPGQLHWLEDWVTALEKGPPIPIFVSRFEDFVQGKRRFLRGFLDFFGISEIDVPSLRTQTVAAMRHFRVGSVDEWCDVLTKSQVSSFESRVEPLAKKFGWKLEPPAWCSGKRLVSAVTIAPDVISTCAGSSPAPTIAPERSTLDEAQMFGLRRSVRADQKSLLDKPSVVVSVTDPTRLVS
jgi:hypothetical protein